ncbi:MAG: hypothetical protein A2928_03935 [Candidatus Taylorbacteria bacterium RIFCSPLOWO2_01_FULL_45_15b]|uniref:Uncharacterized protein n=1 Tax=Candidatus Taylorbacteria bacterium RIFCSPLOWO2_01_FULL_45_15b TaxID=1802319 RepID=A0A1G2NEZ5_9BACT|nr:MAG: hypothetical protein A2928_03935 [Candidatus Taylorbacteria bacterium RIFCSPLOWO2_01_FULL_45_15b]
MPPSATTTDFAETIPGAPIPDVFGSFIVFLKRFLANSSEGISFFDWFYSFWFIFKFIAVFVSLGLILAIIYVLIRQSEMLKARTRKDEIALDEALRKMEPEATPITTAISSGPMKQENVKWKRVMEHVESANANDWRLAILEADIMLDEFMENLGYHGDTLGEKLKKVEKSDMNSIDKAWEAHKIRNLIAHEGGDFVISHREARRVVNMYREVFEEYRYI